MDFFEESGAVKYFDSNKELHTKIPDNPYDAKNERHLWAAYKELTKAIQADDEFEELLSECIFGIEKYCREGYDVEMEALTW